MINYLSLLFLLFLPYGAPAFADVLSYVDDHGTVVYVNNAEQVPLKFRSQLEKKTHTLPPITKLGSPLFKPTAPTANSAGTVARARKVEVLLTSWCPYCKKLEEWLSDQHIPYTRLDIEHDQSAARLHQQLGGGGIPVTRIGSEVIRGFDPAALTEALHAR